ncbi:unnamed protein product [Phytomonas sp. EM1]|nr:unnamed protein product [Phytomonas sp. EM1]|eukprot:CCW59853.1 unnamed protein product [Phytomonas sp. isolate EM1]
MDFDYSFLSQQIKGKDPFDALSDICTMLFLTEIPLIPIGDIGAIVLRLLKGRPNDGDILVMAARTLALILDKFCTVIHTFRNKTKGEFCTRNVSMALEKVLACMTSSKIALLKFEKLTVEELTEESLRCLTLAISLKKEVCAVLPPEKAQLEFCASVLRDSKRLACKVLRHCCILARGGYLADDQNREYFRSMLIDSLVELQVMDVDIEWDELLRAVTEGIVTMRAWCGSLTEGRAAKRVRNGHTSRRTPLSEFLPRKDVTQLYLKLCSRICVDLSANERRRQLVLACTNAVSSAHDLGCLTSFSDWSNILDLVMEILQQTTQGTLRISDPFVRQKKAGDNASEDDTFNLLPNLQWELPDLYWTALILVAKLCNMEPILDEKYVWAWRGYNDDFYRYQTKESMTLTKAFFSAKQNITLKRGGCTIDLLNMREIDIHKKHMKWVHFQCIPYAYQYNNLSFKNVGRLITEHLRQYTKFPHLKKILRSSSFGSNEVAQLCKVIYFHVVCHDKPSDSEDAKHTFSSLIAQQPVDVLEAFSSQLLSRDAMWAPVLLESGIADALTKLPLQRPGGLASARREVLDRTRELQRSPSQAHSPVPPVASRSPHFKTSPVAEVIRETSIRVSLPPPSPSDVALPCSMTAVIEFMGRASCREFMEWLRSRDDAASNPSVLDDSVYPVIEKWLGSNPRDRARVGAFLATYTSQELQRLSMEGMQRGLLTELDKAKPVMLSVCSATRESRCPHGHALRVHFSSNWFCDQCGQTTAYGALSCRLCDYDLCYQCGEMLTGCVKASPTSTTTELLSSWNRIQANRKHHSTDDEEASSPSKEKSDRAKFLYTRLRVLPMSAPVSSLLRDEEGIHAGSSYAVCRCGVEVPSFYVRRRFPKDSEPSSERGELHNTTYWRILSMCREEVSQDPSVTHALIEAVESYATDIFFNGVEGLPDRLRMIMSYLAPFLPLSLKYDIARFLSVDCRRYGLYHIQESHVEMSGIAQDDVNSNGLPHRLTVIRGDLENIVEKISQFFIDECPSLRNTLEIQFESEEGTGTGPTREFYADLSELYRGAKNLWYTQDDGTAFGFPSCKSLFLNDFYVLGVVFSRSFVDGFSMEVPLLPQVWSLLRARSNAEVDSVLSSLLKFLEPTLMNSYDYLLKATKEEIDVMELCDDDDQRVTIENVHAYVSRRITQHFEVGRENLHAMAVGLLSSVDLDSFLILSDEELSALMSGDNYGKEGGKLFTESQLRAVVREAHGYSVGAKEVEMFISIIGGDFDGTQQRLFLEFLTGSSRLPLNGLEGLARKIRVAKKPFEDKGEQVLPSCNTCFFYFKLPPYSSREVMRERLLFAITEGRKNFSLS